MTEPKVDFYRGGVKAGYEGRATGRLRSGCEFDWRYRTCLALCGRGEDSDLLDIGCGDGGFLSMAARAGFSVHGMDIDNRAINLASDGRGLTDVWCANWRTLTDLQHTNRYDVVTMFDVLEHMSKPLEIMPSVLSTLKPGGSVCISVPRYDRWPRLFDPEADFPPHHLTLWTETALLSLLDRSGFTHTQILKKPLAFSDLALHIAWRARRAIVRPSTANRKMKNRERIERSRGTGVATLVKRAAYVSGDALLSILRVGRGYVLLAYAQKPS